jgi:hypothetical protein
VAAAQAQPQTGATAPAIPSVATGVPQFAVLLIFLGTLIGTAIVASVFWKAIQDTKK